MNPIRTVLPACAMAMLLVLGACSSGGDDAAPPTSAAGPSTTARPVDTSFSGRDSARFCDLARTYSDRSTSLGSSPTPAQLRTVVSEGEAAVSQAINAAPGEIKKDVEVLATAFGTFLGELEKVNFDATKLSPDAFGQLQTPEFQASTTRFQAYVTKVCGVPG